MEIVILDGYTMFQGRPWPDMEALGDVRYYDRTKKEDTIARIGNAEIVLVNKLEIGRTVMDACKNIKYIGLLATGYNNVDVSFAKERNITVTNIPSYGTASVAQYVFALILAHCHRTEHHSKTVACGKWTDCPDFCYWDYPQVELEDKVFGIIGYGRIGKAAAKIALAFGMDVIAYDDNYIAAENSVAVKCTSLNDIFKSSDFLSLHCLLNDKTKDIINKDALSLMKPSAVIVNTSRGPLVNESDMADALNNGKIGAYLADVVSEEPIKPGNPLLFAKNCVITPHIAWATEESRNRLAAMAVGNIKSFLAGRPVNTV